MSSNYNTQQYEMKNTICQYDGEKSILLCKSKVSNRKLWIKKLSGITQVLNIIEDEKRFYIACESGDINGEFIALQQESGITDWYIPGKSYMQVIFKNYIYLIFIDENNIYYLIKVNLNTGKKIWHHTVNEDISEYRFYKKRILLIYDSGYNESISILTGNVIKVT